MEFMNSYNNASLKHPFMTGVADILSSFKAEGYRQFILSAREEKELKEEIRQQRLDGIFEQVYGLDDHYAHGKTDVGIKFLRETGIDPASVVFIGDTRPRCRSGSRNRSRLPPDPERASQHWKIHPLQCRNGFLTCRH